MTVRGRTVAALVGIVAVVAALGAFRTWRDGMASHADTAADEAPVAALPRLLDFGRGTCVPCKRMMPVLDELATRHAGRVDVQYLDLSQPANQERAKQLGVRVIPTQVLLSADGTEVARHEGFWALEEIEERLASLGWVAAEAPIR